MTTYSWNTPLPGQIVSATTHRTNWNTAVEELHGKLIEAGLVQTADAGQLDGNGILSLTYNSTGFVTGGFRVYRWEPVGKTAYFLAIKFKAYYTNADSPDYNGKCQYGFSVSAGIGTDGNGNIVGGYAPVDAGYSVDSYNVSMSQSAHSDTENFQSNLCSTDNFFGLIWKLGAWVPSGSAVTPPGFAASPLIFALARTEYDDLLVTHVAPNGATSTSSSANSANSLCGAVPRTFCITKEGSVISSNRGTFPLCYDAISSINGDTPVFNLFYAHPTNGIFAHPFLGVAVRTGATTAQTEFDLTLTGATPRHFLSTPNAAPFGINTSASTEANMVMLWE